MKSDRLKSIVLPVVAGCLLATTVSHAQSNLANGLVAYYPFNGNANDASGNGLDGVVSANCQSIADRFGGLNHAFYFPNDPTQPNEADTARVDIPAAAIDGMNSGTISAWIKPTDTTCSVITAKQHNGVNSYAIFSIGSYSSAGGGPELGNQGTLYFHSQNWNDNAASTTTVTAGTWQHVVVVFTTESCSFYINGNLCGTTAGNFSVPSDLSPDATTIGCWRGDGWNNTIQQSIGAVDDVRIYKRALSSDEVQQLYQAERSPNNGSPRAATGKAVYVKLSNLTVGYNYQVQKSVNHTAWVNYGTPFTATAPEMIYAIFFNESDKNTSFRVITL
jgi:Concanavalin A-like lectin/glucanases superfamily